MNCLLYRLQFNTPVHFGSPDSALSLYSSEGHFRADTLFSALCHTASQLHGESGVQRLIDLAKAGKLLLSDSMPWQGNTLYLPKPYCTAKVKKEQPADQRKKLKKLVWIPVDRFDDYCSAMRTGELFSCEAPALGQSEEAVKAVVPDYQDAVPYPIGIYRFRENTGLYFLMECEDADRNWLRELITALGFSGIGGRVSSGYGKFAVMEEDDLACSTDPQRNWLGKAVQRTEGAQLLLPTSLPAETELEAALDQAGYQLVRRAGFIASDTYAAAPMKKQTQHYLDAGSVLRLRFDGDVYPVAEKGSHRVYRYSKALFLGVTL